jgi:uncharacterized phage-associated protein
MALMVQAPLDLKKMEADPNKVLAAISHVILLAENPFYKLSQYDIVKTLFLADRQHLNKYGRPITYDNYVAMTHGPVPSLSYDLLKANEYEMRRHKIAELPWCRSAGRNGKLYFDSPDVGRFGAFLSDSDRDSLQSAFRVIRGLSFSQIRRLTHEDPAYVNAWKEDGGKAAYDMDLALLFDTPHPEKTEELIEYSQYVQSR